MTDFGRRNGLLSDPDVSVELDARIPEVVRVLSEVRSNAQAKGAARNRK